MGGEIDLVEGLRRAGRQWRLAPLLGQDNIAQTHDQTQRRAQLVADHRQEPALELAGFLGQTPPVERPAVPLLKGSAPTTRQDVFPARQGLAYGLLGLPLAFVALPLYVILPNYYAREFGVPLATLGAILLGPGFSMR